MHTKIRNNYNYEKVKEAGRIELDISYDLHQMNANTIPANINK